mgnify:CR=1 FL=1
MKNEVSAGGVIVKGNEVLLLRDMNGNWTFPKGLVDAGETPEQAVVREAAEEVGLAVVVKAPLTSIEYWYQREGEKIHKTVHYFLCALEKDAEPKPQTDEGISEVRWVPIEEAMKIIGYPKTNRAVLEKTIKALEGDSF